MAIYPPPKKKKEEWSANRMSLLDCLRRAKERICKLRQKAMLSVPGGQVGKPYVGSRKTQPVTIRPVFAVVPKLIPLVNTVLTIYIYIYKKNSYWLRRELEEKYSVFSSTSSHRHLTQVQTGLCGEKFSLLYF